MIYISTYLRLLTLDEEKKKLYAKVFEVEDLKRISPTRWNHEMKGPKGAGLKQKLLLLHYQPIEETTKRYKEGNIPPKHLQQMNLTYSEWQSRIDKGIFNLIGYPGDNKNNLKGIIPLREAYNKKI